MQPQRTPMRMAIVAMLALSAPGLFAQATGTDYVSFWSGDLRIIADADDTEVTMIDIDTGLLLDLTPPRDARVSSANFTTNPFTLDAGDSFEGVGGLGGINDEIRVRIVAAPAVGMDDKRVIVWTGSLSSRHPVSPPTSNNPWGSYIPALGGAGITTGGEVGREFLGFTSREMIITARKGGAATSITVTDLSTNVDADVDDTFVLGPGDAVYSDAEIEIYRLTEFEDDTVRITSNVDCSVEVGISLDTAADWTASPPSFAAGDDGIELGTLFYTFAKRDLTIFPLFDNTEVEITDLSDGDDTKTVMLANGDTIGDYDLYTPTTAATSGGTMTPRPAAPLVTILDNAGNTFDNDYVKVRSTDPAKPILVYSGPVASNTQEYADVSFSVPTGPDSRIVYTFAQNSGSSNDLQIFAFDPDTVVTITSLTRTQGFRAPTFHDFVIGPGVGGAGQWKEGVGSPNTPVWWGSDVWSAETLRIESTRPITVINGDYDSPHFGAFIPFVRTTRTLPPVAVATAAPETICQDECVQFDGSTSFDQDSVPTGLPISWEWDFDTAVDSDMDGDPANDVDATGAMPSHCYPTAGVFEAQLTFTDDEGESDTDFVEITVLELTITCPDNLVTEAEPGDCGATVTFETVAAGQCAVPDVTCTPASGSFFPIGLTMVCCTPVGGGAQFCCFDITVEDVEAPVAICPASISVGTDAGLCGAAVSFAADVADNCPGATITCAPESGSMFPVGITQVCCDAIDASGNVDSCCFDVEVVDLEAPEIQCNTPPTIPPVHLSAGSGSGSGCSGSGSGATPAEPVCFTATATDACGAVTVEIVSYDCIVTAGGSGSGSGSGGGGGWGGGSGGSGSGSAAMPPCEAMIDGDTICVFRARPGITICWTVRATDASGNVSESMCCVDVVPPAPAGSGSGSGGGRGGGSGGGSGW